GRIEDHAQVCSGHVFRTKCLHESPLSMHTVGYTSRRWRLNRPMNSAVNGLLVIDKPAGMTSRAVVNRVQGWFPRGTAIGHTGTLDPLATGVLVVCLGSATRLTEYVQDMDKTYRARLLLGARSDTDDADGSVVKVEVAEPPSAAAV